MNIILKKRDGEVAVMSVAPGADAEDAIRKFKECHPEYIEHFESNQDLPKNRVFRDAWKVGSNNKLFIDEKKAKEIHLGRIRHVRDAELDRLDRRQLRYMLDAAKVAEIEAKKQILRDLPATFSLEGMDLDNPAWPQELLASK